MSVLTVGVALGLLGVLIGSFLNVVAYRVPAGLSVVSPPSACPRCEHEIRARDNVPVLSWLALAGRCRDCRSPISARYPLVELGTGLAFVLVAVRFAPIGITSASDLVARLVALVAFLYLMAVSVALALIDVDVHRLPDALVLPSYAVLAVLLGAAGLLDGDAVALARAAAGAGLLVAFYLALALAKPGGMGLGDVKLAGVLGLALGYLGWAPLVVGAVAAFAAGGSFAIVLIVTRRAGRGSGIPFGPWMLAGAWIGIVAGRPIASLYLHLTGLA